MKLANELLDLVGEKLSDQELVLLFSLGPGGDRDDELVGAKKDPKAKKTLQKLVKMGLLDKNFKVTSQGDKMIKDRQKEIKDLIGA